MNIDEYGHIKFNNYDDYKKAYDNYSEQAEYIIRYLYLIGEECTIIKMYGSILLLFDKGIKNKDLSNTLSVYMTDDIIGYFPANTAVINRINSVIFSY